MAGTPTSSPAPEATAAEAPVRPASTAGAGAGATAGAGAGDGDAGWVTARPPRAAEVALRILSFPRLLARHRDLVTTSVRRELRARFTGTALGWAWPLLHPLFLFAVYYFIFTKLLDFKFPELPEGQESAFGIFMFVGVMVWAAFAESLNRGTTSIVDNGNLIKKLAFPSEILPLNVVLVGLVTLLFAAGAFVVAAWTTPVWLPPGWRLLWIPVLLLLQATFTYGLVLLLATLHVFLRDTAQVVQVAATIWMFLTPIFWAPELVGDSIDPYLWVVEANPMYHLVHAWRVVLMSSEPALAFGHDFGAALWTFAAWSVGAFAVGYGAFVLGQRRFADEV